MNNNERKISIIVPVYNVEKYLNKCVDSIIKQTYSNIEIILINDGSIDNSGKLCDHYANQDNRIKVIHQENQGLSMARNNGIVNATGNYIGFVDSDDWIDHDMFEVLYKNILNFDVDISICRYRYVTEDGNIIDNKYLQNHNCCVKILRGEDIIKHNLLSYGKSGRISESVWNKLYERSLFNEIRFPSNKIYEDVFVTYLLLDNAQSIAISSECKYNYLQRSDSISNQSVSLKTFDIIEGSIQRYEYIKSKYPDFEPLCRKLLLMNIVIVLYMIAIDKMYEAYKDKINELLAIVQKQNIYSCELPKEYLKLLELFLNGNREWLIAMKFYENKLNKF